MTQRLNTSLEAPIKNPKRVQHSLLHDPVPKEMLDALAGRPTTHIIQPLSTDYRSTRKHKRKTGCTSVIKSNFYEQLEKRRRSINDRLLKILERVELERPITFKEKFDVLWNAGGVADKDAVSHAISK